jgi:hypothetical protein
MARDTGPRGSGASDAPSKDARAGSSSKASKLKPSAKVGEAAGWFSGSGLRRRLSQEPKDSAASSERDAAPRRAARKGAPLPVRLAGAAAAMLIVGVPLIMLAGGGRHTSALLNGARQPAAPRGMARGGDGGDRAPPGPGSSALTATMSACAAQAGLPPPVSLLPASPPPPLGAPLALEHDPLRELHLDCGSMDSKAACSAIAADTNEYSGSAGDDLLPAGYLDSWRAYSAAAILTERAAAQSATAPSQLDALALNCEADAEACAGAASASNEYGEAAIADAYVEGVAEALVFLGAVAPAAGAGAASERDHDPLAVLGVDCDSDGAAAAACEAARRASNAYGEEVEGEWAADEDAAAAEHDHGTRLFEGTAQPEFLKRASSAPAGSPAEVYHSWPGDDAALAVLEARKRAAVLERQRAAEWLGTRSGAATEVQAGVPTAEAVGPSHPARTYFKNPCNNPWLSASYKNLANDPAAHAGRTHYKNTANDPLLWMASAVEAPLAEAPQAASAASRAAAATGSLWSEATAWVCTGLAGVVAFAYLQGGGGGGCAEHGNAEETGRTSSQPFEAAAQGTTTRRSFSLPLLLAWPPGPAPSPVTAPACATAHPHGPPIPNPPQKACSGAPAVDTTAFGSGSPRRGAPAPAPPRANLKTALLQGMRPGPDGDPCSGGDGVDVDVVPSGAIDSPRRSNTPLFGRSATPLSVRRALHGSPEPAGDE